MVNYHNHTTFCGHASGTIEEYIEKAITLGIKEMGFSDHAPIPLPFRSGISMSPEETEAYITVVEKSRERYRDRIAIKIGFEVDFPILDSFDKKYFSDARIDFLIGSCHFMGDWLFDHPDYIGGYENRDIDEVYSEYYRILHDLVISRLFDITGHFDVIKKFGHRPNRDFSPEVEKIARSMARFGIAAEINTSGLFHPVNEIYPSDSILKIFYNCNVPITLGSDTHATDMTGFMFHKALENIKKAGYRKISGFTRRRRYDIAL